jgi:hypothetical protein
MSKKLIAVAAAAALALTAFAGVPANASTFTTAVFDASSDSALSTAPTTALLAAVHTAPESNAIQHSKTVTRASNTSVRFDLTGTADKTITVTSDPSVKLLAKTTDADGNAVKTTAGSNSITGVFAAGGTYTFYAFTTSNTAGKVTITSEGNAQTYYVKSKVGAAYNVSATLPTSLVVDAAAVYVYATVTDVFGNVIDSDNAGNVPFYNTTYAAAFATSSSKLVLSGINATVASSGNAWSWDTTKKAWKSTGITTTTAGQSALSLNLTTTDYEVGFAAPKNTVFATSSSGSLTAQVTALTAQVAALTASVTALTADYNSVAKKYNKLVKKSKRVALK